MTDVVAVRERLLDLGRGDDRVDQLAGIITVRGFRGDAGEHGLVDLHLRLHAGGGLLEILTGRHREVAIDLCHLLLDGLEDLGKLVGRDGPFGRQAGDEGGVVDRALVKAGHTSNGGHQQGVHGQGLGLHEELPPSLFDGQSVKAAPKLTHFRYLVNTIG